MYILLAAATTFEIQPTLDHLGHRAPGEYAPETGVLVTGAGSVSAIYSLMRQIGSRRPDLVIQAGIAGCFTGRKAGDVVIVEEEVLADLGVWEQQAFKTLFDLGLADKDGFPFSDGGLVNPYTRLLALAGPELVKGITVNEITTDPVRTRWYQQNIHPVVESMEGGAFHFVCLQENIPFLQMRSVSNVIGERDKTKWDIRGAIGYLNESLIAFLEKLTTADASVFDR